MPNADARSWTHSGSFSTIKPLCQRTVSGRVYIAGSHRRHRAGHHPQYASVGQALFMQDGPKRCPISHRRHT
ncbi:hypothetical protein [Neoasaia chiangmaiensis]|nr:hypothetical protein [Neoasaia chiangmaiensis]